MVSKSKIAVIVLMLASVAYVSSSVYAEVSSPTLAGGLGPGDIFVEAYEVLPTENQSIWKDSLRPNITSYEEYKGELVNPNIYVKTATEKWWDFVIVPPEEDFEFETGVYLYNGHYYLIRKSASELYVDVFISREEWLDLQRRQQFILAGTPLTAAWIGLGVYKLKNGKKQRVF
jgi:hypothetical protein